MNRPARAVAGHQQLTARTVLEAWSVRLDEARGNRRRTAGNGYGWYSYVRLRPPRARTMIMEFTTDMAAS